MMSVCVAPPGCLQYYPDRAGFFESFNYNRGAGPYIANLAYATCFKRTSDVCGIKSVALNDLLIVQFKKIQYRT